MQENLGSSDGLDNRNKAFFFFYVMMILGFMFLASIGASESSKSLIYFYIGFAVVLFLIPFFWDQFSKTSNYIETVTVEETDSKGRGIILQVVVGLIVSGLTVWRAVTQNKAWVNAPSFGVFDNKVGEAILSGMGGLVENWIFFGFVFPTLYINFKKKFPSLISFIISASVCSTIFMFSHKMWVYKFNEVALVSTFLFAFINCIFTFAFKSLIVSEMLHFSNNLGVGLQLVKKIGFSVAI